MNCRRALAAIGLIYLVAAWSSSSAQDLADVWRYSGTITNRETRSEGFTGALSFDGKQVPAKVGQILTPIGEYEFVTEAMPWSVRGWKKTSGLAKSAKSGQNFDAGQESGTHWYKGGWRRGTPGSWLYLPSQQVWVDPHSLNAYAETELKDSAEPDSVMARFLKEAGVQQQAVTGIAVFTYELGTSAKGSKSAGERGVLTYNGRPIPAGAGSLKTPIGSFTSASGNMLWEPQGWFPTEEEINVEDSVASFRKADREHGNYTGPRKAGTPTEWCYIPETKTWSAPERLQ